MFTASDKKEFAPSEHVSPLLVINCSSLLQKINIFALFSSIRIVLGSLYLLISYFEKFST